jgi:hypothetical protein
MEEGDETEQGEHGNGGAVWSENIQVAQRYAQNLGQ